jgi:hypothetical protein
MFEREVVVGQITLQGSDRLAPARAFESFDSNAMSGLVDREESMDAEFYLLTNQLDWNDPSRPPCPRANPDLDDMAVLGI